QFNLNSPKQLGEMLFGENGLRLPYPKKSKSGSWSTSAEILQKLAPYHPVIEDILDYRQVTKLKSTYVDGLLRVVGEDGQVHTNFKQTGTVTGRLSSAEPNLQNIPIRTELGRELRRFFVPSREGYVLIDADYSQIELRLMAAITNDEHMCAAFRDGTDIHTSTAAKVFGVAPENVTIEMRKSAKAINFGILYGMGEFSLAEDLHISRKAAKEYIDNYLDTYPKIDEYLKNIKKEAAEKGYVTTILGRRRYIPELSSPNKMVRGFGERVAMNSPIQGSAADIIKIAMIAVDRRLK
ncbi:MAG: DNA polymerase I, partial [Clostridia bacterium]|nr:DNA polymerase I [Clostridia bacterium]